MEVGTGDKLRTFEVPKGILCFYSGYFDAALNGPYIEAQEHVCHLPEEDPIIFEGFVYWLCWRRWAKSYKEAALNLSYLVSGLAACHHTPIQWHSLTHEFPFSALHRCGSSEMHTASQCSRTPSPTF